MSLGSTQWCRTLFYSHCDFLLCKHSCISYLTGNFRKGVVRLNWVAKWVAAWKSWLKTTGLEVLRIFTQKMLVSQLNIRGVCSCHASINLFWLRKILIVLFVTDQPWCMTDQPWRIIWCLYTTLMSKIFPQESSEAFLNLKKSALPRTKKTSPTCFNRVLWKALRKKGMVPFGFSKKRLFGTLPPLLNEPMGFLTKLLEKQFKDSP